MPMVSGQDRHDLTATLQMFAECISSLERRVEAMQVEIERLTALTRHITPECPECGMRAFRVALHGDWMEAHTAECSRGKRITHP